MTDIEQKRAWVSGMYPSLKWRKKVKKMSEEQVIAIYLKHHGEPPKKEPEDPQQELPF